LILWLPTLFPGSEWPPGGNPAVSARYRHWPFRCCSSPVAQLTGEARHHARWRDLTADEETAAVAALRELAGGRADLLAEVAGILQGASEGEPDEPFARRAAGLCWLAGADPEAIPAWAEEGRRRRAAARIPPPSGGVRRYRRKHRRVTPPAGRRSRRTAGALSQKTPRYP